MDWLAGIFSEKQQQAQLVAMLFSVTVAVTVLFLNQWFLSRRARRDILIKKIEESYIAVEEYKRSAEAYMMRCFSGNENIDEDMLDHLYEDVCLNINKVSMYFDLYFSDSKIDLDKSDELMRSVFINYHIERWNWGAFTNEKLSILGKEHAKYSYELSCNIQEMNKFLIIKMKENKH